MDNLAQKVIAKNIGYGNSLHSPLEVFTSKPSTLTRKQLGICCRLDDKLNRIKTVGLNKETYDTVDDLIGYLVHLKMTING